VAADPTVFSNLPDHDDDRAVLLRVEAGPATSTEQAGLLAALLFDWGATGIEERRAPDGGPLLLAGFPNRSAAAQALSGLRAGPPGAVARAVVDVPEDTWFDGWRAYARTQRAGRHLLVHPPWVPLDVDVGPGDVVLEIDPGRAFGSGAHPTTRLVLAQLEAQADAGAVRGRRVLDLGCGSGVLAVAAGRLGAAEVVAVDIDALARAATRENLRRNAVRATVLEGLDELEGRVRQAGAPPFDLVLANIGAGALIALAPMLCRTGRTLILSGFFASGAPGLVSAYARCDATPLNSTLDDGEGGGEGDGWMALTFETASADTR
jgi:ribosomal protein L11 methyltransferase